MVGLPGQTCQISAGNGRLCPGAASFCTVAKVFKIYPGLSLPAGALDTLCRGDSSPRAHLVGGSTDYRPRTPSYPASLEACTRTLYLAPGRGGQERVGMRALVTGGAGFVGSAVVRQLLQEGIAVSCLVRKTSDLRNLSGMDVTLVEGDLSDRRRWNGLWQGASSSTMWLPFIARARKTRNAWLEVNVEGTRHILSVAADSKLERIVHTSTIGTIGRPPDGRLPTEADTFNDWAHASPYARSKIEAERCGHRVRASRTPRGGGEPLRPGGARRSQAKQHGRAHHLLLEGTRALLRRRAASTFVGVDDVARGHLLAARRGACRRALYSGARAGQPEAVRLSTN